tara:strand:- start:173 stop:277 length:105 start_codon:yes stop_codon:yes gene_type:complete
MSMKTVRVVIAQSNNVAREIIAKISYKLISVKAE